MSRIVRYVPKYTSAATQYVEMTEADSNWLLGEMTRITLEQCQLHPSNEEKLEFDNLYWRRAKKSLPRGRQGLNTPEMFVTGLLHNIMYGSQKDFTVTQLEALSSIFAVYAQCWPQHNVEPFVPAVGLFK